MIKTATGLHNTVAEAIDAAYKNNMVDWNGLERVISTIITQCKRNENTPANAIVQIEEAMSAFIGR